MNRFIKGLLTSWVLTLFFPFFAVAAADSERIGKEGYPVTLVDVILAPDTYTRIYPGVVKEASCVSLAFRVGGPLLVKLAPHGRVVKKGDLLMAVDKRDYIANLKILEGRYENAKRTLEFAKSEYERQKSLMQSNATSQSAFDKAENVYLTAKASLITLEAEIRVARNQLEDTELRAPFDGIINKSHVAQYDMIKAGETVISLCNVSYYKANVDIPESEISGHQLKTGSEAILTFPGQGAYPVALREWSMVANEATRTYRLIFYLDPPKDMTVLSGMIIEVAWSKNAEKVCDAPTLIPVGSISSDPDGKSFVWIYDPETSTAQKRTVTLSKAGIHGKIMVSKGLCVGERVIHSGAAFIYEGQKLLPVENSGANP